MKLFIVGASGRMGKTLREILKFDGNWQFSGGYDQSEIPEERIYREIHEEIITASDMLIDFSHRETLSLYLPVAVKWKKPVVIGTTGLDTDDMDLIRESANYIPVFYSPNMSFGVGVLFYLVGNLAVMMGSGYDIEILEKHHNRKKDAPSGTAKKILDIIREKRPNLEITDYRSGMCGERKKTELGVQVIRAGDIIGEHTVLFAGQGEVLEITHEALSREVFARGALRAALFLTNKDRGLFSMHDIVQESIPSERTGIR